MISNGPSTKESWFKDAAERLRPIELRPALGWTPCHYDPYFFDCTKCEIDWSACALRSDPDLRIYLAYRRIGDPAAFASAGHDDPLRQSLVDRITVIISMQGAPVPVGVLARVLSSEYAELFDIARIESIVGSTSDLDLAKNGLVSKQDTGSQRQQYLGPWWASHDVDSGQAIAAIQRSKSAADRKSQHLLLKHYQALSLVKDCTGVRQALNRIRRILADGLDMAVEATGMSIHELTLIASSPSVTKLDIHENGGDKTVQQAVSKVLAAISAEDLLNKDPSIDLASAAHELKCQVVELNYSLVVGRALHYAWVGSIGFADLVQQGVLGMLTAVDKYDPYMGFQFSTYARWWINQSITREIADKSRTVRMPVHVVERLNKVLYAIRDHENEKVDLPNYDELLSTVEADDEELVNLLSWATQVVRLDLGEHDYEQTRHFDEPSYPSTSDPIEAIGNSLDREVTESLLAKLQDREQRVLRLRFGLDDGRARTLQEIGGELNLTRERIRQIERKALRRCRTLMSKITRDPVLARDEDDSLKRWADSVFVGSNFKLAPESPKKRTRSAGSSVPRAQAKGRFHDQIARETEIQRSGQVITQFFTNRGIDVIDKRKSGGALWVMTDDDDPEITQKLKDLNFQYLRKGGKTSLKRPAWHIK